MLGKDGAPFSGRDSDTDFFHALVRTFDPLDPDNPDNNPSISNDANYYNLKYDPFSDSFIATWTDSNSFTFGVKVTLANEEVEGPIVNFRLDGNYSSTISGLLRTSI